MQIALAKIRRDHIEVVSAQVGRCEASKSGSRVKLKEKFRW